MPGRTPEARLMRAEPPEKVVYRMALFGGKLGQDAVCSQAEWDQMRASVGDRHVLIRGRIGNGGRPSGRPAASRPHRSRPRP